VVNNGAWFRVQRAALSPDDGRALLSDVRAVTRRMLEVKGDHREETAANFYGTQAALLLGLGNPDEALRALDEGEKLAPGDPGRSLLRARALMARGDRAGAKAEAERARGKAHPEGRVARQLAELQSTLTATLT
jgi:hypothetical protein